MSNIVLNAPLNSLSFGQVSFQIMRALYEKGVSVSLHPIGDRISLESYDIEQDFAKWIQSSLNGRFNYKKEDLTIKIWHLDGAHTRLTQKQNLLTFHETDTLTPVEVRMAQLQDNVILSSLYSKSVFDDFGADNCRVVGLAESSGITKLNKNYKTDSYIHFGLMGKWEKRKNTELIIRTWARKFGNNAKYRLTCCVTNPFIKHEDMERLKEATFDGKRYWNISFLPYLEKNSEVNDFLNSTDVDLTGLSNAEGWNMPAYNSTVLGKWSCVTNCTAHKEWATNKNSILIEPVGVQPVYDGVFFQPERHFNQGMIFKIGEEQIIEALEKVIKVAKERNTEGENLKDKFDWKKTVENIII